MSKLLIGLLKQITQISMKVTNAFKRAFKSEELTFAQTSRLVLIGLVVFFLTFPIGLLFAISFGWGEWLAGCAGLVVSGLLTFVINWAVGVGRSSPLLEKLEKT